MDITALLGRTLLVLLPWLPLVVGDCLDELMKCTEPMTDIDVILLGVEAMDREQLTQHCTTYGDIESCIRDNLYNCKTDVWDSVGRLRATFSSICYEDFDVYINHSACLSDLPSEDACRKEYKSDIVKLTKSSKTRGWVQVFTLNGTAGALCNATYDYLGCIETAANATCGQEAAQFQHDLLRKGLMYELEDVDCYLGYDSSGETAEDRILVKPGLSLAAVAAIGLGIAVGIAVLAVVSRYLCLKLSGEMDPDEGGLLGEEEPVEGAGVPRAGRGASPGERGGPPGRRRGSAPRAGPSTSRGGAEGFTECASAVV